MNRKKFFSVYIGFFLILYIIIFFGLKFYSHKKFNDQSLNQLITGKSKYRDITDNLCKFQILGEPKVDKDYIKINFWCNDTSKARSTLSLVAFKDKTADGVLQEYARIIGFDYKIIKDKNWFCTLNDQEIDSKVGKTIVPLASTIDCFETKGLSKHD